MPLPNGAALKAIRQAQGWKTVKLAEAVGISASHLSGLESPAVRKYASHEVMRKLADTLGVPLAAITGTYSPEQIAGPVLVSVERVA